MNGINYMKLTIGEKITMLRKQDGKMLEEVAAHLKVSMPVYIKMENDFIYPNDHQLAKLGSLYGMTYNEVVNYGEDG